MLFERYFPTNLHEVHCRFVKGLQELSLDQTTMLLFLAVILLSPDRPNLEQPKKVEKLQVYFSKTEILEHFNSFLFFQEYYLMILRKYMFGRYGMPKASALYPKLLSKMADIQELSDCHQEQYLLFAQDEVQSVKEELNRIQTDSLCFESGPFENQQQLSSFGQTFASPISESHTQEFMTSPLPSTMQTFFPQTSPLSDPNSDGGYMSFEEKQGFYFDAIPQPSSFDEREIQNTLQQGECL